ncbi:MAG: aminoacetone oxidase family FAD-binding enzyme [Eubacteriales bacterium]|nr:aminoacetone oxidase family FAD-binding enzyme [Eubacteriales bacterium]
MDTLIIGGGAAGAAAAIAAAEKGSRVTVLERNRKALKKLGVTGNGRGNLQNEGAPRYYGDVPFAQQVLSAAPPKALREWWSQLGVPLCTEEEGRVYPSSLLAASAVDALLFRMAELGVRILPNLRVTALTHTSKGFFVDGLESVYGDDRSKANGKIKKGELLAERPVHFQADRVIVTAGGKAAPTHGTDGTAYTLLQGLGHSLVEPRPALCALLTDTAPVKGLSGQRVRAKLTLCSRKGSVLHQSQGEALFADDGVSGIAAMQLARFIEVGSMLELDLREALWGNPEGDCEQALRSRIELLPSRTLASFFTGATTDALSWAILKAADLTERNRSVLSLTAGEVSRLASAITAFPLSVLGTRGFDAAQVTAGGISTDEFDPATMESRLVPGLYAAGEILNVDGDCGGYNLMFAFSSGLLAGGAL